MKRVLFVSTVLFFLVALAGAVAADESCRKLAEPVSGDGRLHAVTANVYGSVAFADIGCAVYWRKKHFCAMEMTSFDATAKVVDYFTGAEVEMTKAYFAAEVPGHARVKAFATRADAEKFAAEAGGGAIFDFKQLTD
jgi:hypothetical protein